MEWVSVEDRLPETKDVVTVLVVRKNFRIDVADFFTDDESPRFRETCLRCFKNITTEVTHWQPLPPPPKD